MNDHILKTIESRAKKLVGGNVDEVYVITPKRENIEADDTFGKPERIPDVICFAQLYSYDDESFKKRLTGNSDDTMTCLTLVWFQEDFGTPEAETLEQIKNIPWTKVCGEYSD